MNRNVYRSTIFALAVSISALATAGINADARGHHGGYSHHSYRSYSHGSYHSHSRMRRSREAKAEFERASGYPHGRPGYVVDHIIPLACGGADSPSNMQWQTVAAGKAKDMWERKGCSHRLRFR